MVAAGTADWNGQMERQTESQVGKAELAWKEEALGAATASRVWLPSLVTTTPETIASANASTEHKTLDSLVVPAKEISFICK